MSEGLISEFFTDATWGTRSGLYGNCGWTSNLLGTFFDNTCYHYENPSPTVTGIHFYHYRITIIPDADGKPNTASLSLIGDGHPKKSGKLIDFYMPQGNGALTNLQLSLCPLGSGCTQLGSEGEESTLYVFYLGDTLKSVLWKNSIEEFNGSRNDPVFIQAAIPCVGSSVPDNLPGILSSSSFLDDKCYPCSLSDEGSYEDSSGGEDWEWEQGKGQTGVSGTKRNGDSGGFFIDTIEPKPYLVILGWFRRLWAFKIDKTVNADTGGSGAPRTYPYYYEVGRRDRFFTDFDYSSMVSIVIPNGERAAVFVYDYNSEIEEWSIERYEAGTNDPHNAYSVGGSWRGGGTILDPCFGAGHDVPMTPCGGGETAAWTATYYPKTETHCLSGFAVNEFIYDWNDSFTPYTITYDCTGSAPATIFGWCTGRQGKIGWRIPYSSRPSGGKRKWHFDTLSLISNGFSGQIFSRSEEYDTTPENEFGDTIGVPGWGNDFFKFVATGAERMDCFTDTITGLQIYSPDMDKNEGTQYLGEFGEYPITELPKSVTRAWIGLPGDTT